MSTNHLDLNNTEVFEAIKDVRDDKTSTNWCLFGYVPKTSKLKLIAKGDGSVSELAAEVSDGKLHFGYLRKEMSETWKFVVIAWCGEGVPAQTKGLFTGHTTDYEAWLRKNNFNYSALISARVESDLDESEIAKALNKTSTFIRARTTKDQPVEALKTKSAQFWNQQSQVDAQHKEVMQQNAKQRADELVASRAATEEKLKAEADKIMAEREAERQAEVDTFHRFESERNKQQQERLEQQRGQVFNRLNERKQAETREVDASSTSAPPAPAPRVGGQVRKFPPAQQEQQQQQAEKPKPKPISTGAVKKTGPPPPPAASNKPAPTKATPPPPPVASNKPKPAPKKPEPEPEPEPIQEEQPVEEQSGWGNEQPAAEEQQPAAEEQYQEEQQPAAEEQYQEEQQPAAEEQYQEEQQPAAEEQYQEEQPAETAAGGVQAKALYDYAAAQEGDLEFKEGDIINIVDQSDPSGWWQGELNGVTGTFPSNFVELIQ